MRLYAVTYTDLSEPWGEAVWENKLYANSYDAVLAYVRCYQEFAKEHGDAIRENMRACPEDYGSMSPSEVIQSEFSREFALRYDYELVR